MSGPGTSQTSPTIYSRRYLNVQSSTAVVWISSQKHGSCGYTFVSLKYHEGEEKHSEATVTSLLIRIKWYILTETLRSMPPILIRYWSTTKGGKHETEGLHCPVFTRVNHLPLSWTAWIQFTHSHSLISESRENVKIKEPSSGLFLNIFC